MKPLIDHSRLIELLDYDPDTGVFTMKYAWGKKRPGDRPGGLSPQGYWYIGIGGNQYPAHRLAWFYVHKQWPDGVIDHINRNRLDNRISNLRCVTYSKNLHNAVAARASSGVRGVNKVAPNREKRTKKIWSARIRVADKNYWLGNYYTIEEAKAARKAAEIRLGVASAE